MGKKLVFLFTTFFVLGSCAKKKTVVIWNKNFPVIGSQSSPRATDLNQDGVLDIVIGAGKNENQDSDQGIIALDGKTGDVLWQHEAQDQVFGSATFLDITDDGVKDIFIGGRSCNFRAINGKTGSLIWFYEPEKYQNDPILKYARFNFYNSVLVPDQNEDGKPDLLVVNGGNVKAKPHSEENRFPGVLMLLNAETGHVIAADTMPDGKESYMSPLFVTQPNGEELIVFGTGGETVSGHLYICRLSDLLTQKLANAQIIASENGHGFIAPPVAADITEDGFYDIVAISHGSRVFALDGRSRQLLWKQQIANTESSNSFAVGYFTKDHIPDFFTFISKGEWPQSTGSLQVLFDGKDGRLIYLDSIGCTGFSSPVVYDLNKDGQEEAIISINEYDCKRGFTDQSQLTIENKLLAIDFSNKLVATIDQLPQFKNIFSTPWIGDLDEDGYLDIVHCQYYNPSSDLLSFLGMNIKRISTHIKVKKQPDWGAYMGSNGDGLFGRK